MPATLAKPPEECPAASRPGQSPVIALADPRWFGHHPTYFKEFTASFLRLGCRVLAFCQNPAEAAAFAEDWCKADGRRAAEWFRAAALPDPNKSYLIPGRDHDPLSTAIRWRRLRAALREAERASGWRADAAFLAFLDAYIRFLPHHHLAEASVGIPWSGLYFRNHHLGSEGTGALGALRRFAKGDARLRSLSCAAIGVLDERFDPALSAASRGTPIIHFPDITDEAMPDEPTPLAREILRRASGRKVVGLIGLEKRKGFLTLLRAALGPSADDPLFFVCAGQLGRPTLTGADLAFLDRAAKAENVFLDLDGARIPDGAEFNAVMAAMDIVFAAYEAFPGSSNTLTKAALVERPVLGSRGGCIEHRISEFGLGICIDEGDEIQCAAALRQLASGKDWSGDPLRPRYADYRAAHSRQRMDEALGEFLAAAGVRRPV
ncbi:MAG: hypothetical protein R3F11_22600 [Verrucomicrobiales bacterium]